MIVLRASRRAKGRTVLLLGAPDSGKTTLFFQLLDGSTHNGTVASMQPNERTADEKSDLAGATLVDVPGHPRVRGEWESHLPTSRGIVFLVDGVNFLPIKTAVAECVRKIGKRGRREGGERRSGEMGGDEESTPRGGGQRGIGALGAERARK